MRFALVNPDWDFTGSTYFGCKEPHIPLELLYSAAKVRETGHDAMVVDAQSDHLSIAEVKSRLDAFDPDFLVIPSTPSYLFWRCPPPEVRVPAHWFAGLRSRAKRVLVGPHGSATPIAAMKKTGADIVIRGECEQAIADLAKQDWRTIEGICWRDLQGEQQNPGLAQVDMRSLAALDFLDYNVEGHSHRHHVFFGEGRGAELEFARGCPWNCTFCNKQLFRNKFRERRVETLIAEVDTLISRGVDYIYFIDEIFGVGRNVRRLLEAVAERNVQIGFQTRIDLWDEESIDLLARAHTISIECGVESITEEGREELNKNCRMSTERISELLIYAKQRIPWVQANLILTDKDDRNAIVRWQQELKSHGVWVSEPVPMFPYPGSPLYLQTFGAAPDDQAWERAHAYYTNQFHEDDYSDIQEHRPLQLVQLESMS
jgi:B12-binding domain/radical SAM domain protein of rhizo-twelve system